jgi:hypothetical protein
MGKTRLKQFHHVMQQGRKEKKLLTNSKAASGCFIHKMHFLAAPKPLPLLSVLNSQLKSKIDVNAE